MLFVLSDSFTLLTADCVDWWERVLHAKKGKYEEYYSAFALLSGRLMPCKMSCSKPISCSTDEFFKYRKVVKSHFHELMQKKV